MRLLANENIPELAVTALRAHGYDVVWIREDAPGIDDLEILSRATHESRILITFDKDFGELIFRSGLNATSEIIFFRILPASPSVVAQAVVTALESRTGWEGHFSVVDESRVRMRPLETRH